MARLRFVHTADWHLGAGFGTLPEDVAEVRRRQQRESIGSIVQCAVAPATRADLFLVAGDIFDTPRPDPSAVAFFESQLRCLAEAGVQVFMVPGTSGHDAYRANGIWERTELYGAHLFRDPVFTSKIPVGFDDLAVWGIACDPSRPDENLLATAAGLDASPHSIGLYHGGLSGGFEGETERGNTCSRDDIERAPFRYLALGHYHRLNTVFDAPEKKAFYPGSPTAVSSSFSELGKRYAVAGELSGSGDLAVSPLELLPSFGIHEAKTLDATRLSLSEINEQLREWADPNTFMTVSLIGIVPPEIMAEARQLEQQHRNNYGYLRLSLDFNDLSGAEENEYLRLFREHARKAIEEAEDEGGKALLREGLMLGTEALLHRGRR